MPTRTLTFKTMQYDDAVASKVMKSKQIKVGDDPTLLTVTVSASNMLDAADKGHHMLEDMGVMVIEVEAESDDEVNALQATQLHDVDQANVNKLIRSA